MKITKISAILIVCVIFAISVNALEVVSPTATEYNHTDILLEITSNETLSNITYQVDDLTFVLVCNNCSAFNDTIHVDEGNHTLTVKGTLDNVTDEISVDFKVILPNNITINGTDPINGTNQTENNQTNTTINLKINNPNNIVYGHNEIPFNFTTDINSTINYTLNDIIFNACESCKEFSIIVELNNGAHNLTVEAFADNLSEFVNVIFTVNGTFVNDTDEINDTNQSDDKPRFTIGLNKLPQAIANGELTDAELADIIRNNKINPGIINRLIKTGKLGEESIDAILNTQFTPPGILKKILAFFGFSTKSSSRLIYETYNISINQKQKIVAKDDISEEIAETIKEDLKQNLDFKIEKDVKKPEAKSNNGKKEASVEKKEAPQKNKNANKSKNKTGKQKGKTNKISE